MTKGAPEGTYKVNAKLWPLLVDVETIHVDPENRRKHPPRSIEDIATSYKKFGQQKPLVVRSDGTMVAGEGQYIAATTKLGWTHIAAVVFDGDPQDAMTYGLVDNRTQDQSVWDYEGLGVSLRILRDQGVDLSEIGWQPHEATTIVLAEWQPAAIKPMVDHGMHQLLLDAKQWKVVQRVTLMQRREDKDISEVEAVMTALKAFLK